MDFQTVAKPAFHLAGLAIDTSFANQAKDAGKLAAQFFHLDFASRVAGKLDPATTYSLHADWNEATGAYRMVFAYEVTADASQPADILSLTVPAGRYSVFNARGSQPQAQIKAWEFITSWRAKPDLERAGDYSFQIHGPRSRGLDPEVDIYIPMIPRRA